MHSYAQWFWALPFLFFGQITYFHPSASAWEPTCVNTGAPGFNDLCLARDPRSFQLEARQGAPFQSQLKHTYTPQTLPFSLESGTALPPGLSLSSSGLLSGTPSTTGVYDFTVRQVVSSTDIRRLYVHLVVTPAIDRFNRYDFSDFGPYEVHYQSITVPFPYPITLSGATNTTAVIASPNVNNGTRFPLYVFWHGTGISPQNYEQYLRRVASWGFVAVSPLVADQTGWPRISSNAMAGSIQLREVFDHTMSFLNNTWSYRERINSSRLGVGGHSMGADEAWLSPYFIPKVFASVVIDPAGNTAYLHDPTHNLGVYYEPPTRIPNMLIGMTSSEWNNGGTGFMAGINKTLYARDVGPKAWVISSGSHAGFTNGTSPYYGPIPAETTAEQLPLVTHFTVAHLLRHLYDNLSVNGALYTASAFPENNNFETPLGQGYSYAFDRFGYQGINSSFEKVVDDFREQYPGNETQNLLYNNLLQPITDTTYQAEEGPPARFEPPVDSGATYDHLLESHYRVRQLNDFSIGRSFIQRLGSSSSPFNSINYTHLLLNWTKLNDGELGPVSIRLKDSSGAFSNQVSATPYFQNRWLPHTMELDLSSFTGINRATLTEIQLVSGADSGTNFDLDDIRFVKSQVCATDAIGMHPHYYSNPLPSGKPIRLSACGMRNWGQDITIRVDDLPVGSSAQFYLSLVANPTSLYGGVVVPDTGAPRHRVFSRAASSDGSSTLVVPGAAQAAQVCVQVVAQVAGMQSGERVVSEPLLIKQILNLNAGEGGSGRPSRSMTFRRFAKMVNKASRSRG